MYGASHDLQQETLQLLAAKDAENFRLRQLLFESVEKFDDLNMSYVSQEAELKFANKRDVEKVQKELNMRVSQCCSYFASITVGNLIYLPDSNRMVITEQGSCRTD